MKKEKDIEKERDKREMEKERNEYFKKKGKLQTNQ